MARVALYTRVSTEEQAVHGYSLDAQRTALEEWAAANHHSIAGVYSDEGISARKPAAKRPALQRLLQAVEQGRVDLVAFTKLDRWFRNVAEYYKVQPILEKYGASWTAIHEDYETATASGRLKVNIMLSVAQDEADRTGERIKSIYKARREQGQPIINTAPTGYILQGGVLYKDPAAEAGVTAFFQELLSSGRLVPAIRAAGEKGLFLLRDTARYMRASPTYAGVMQGCNGAAPAYITYPEWESLQSTQSRPRYSRTGSVYIFSGLVFCATCGARFDGSTMRRSTKSGELRLTKRYSGCCTRRYSASKHPGYTVMREVTIEEYLLNAVYPAFTALQANLSGTGVQRDREQLEAAIRALEAKEGRLKELYLSGLYTFAELRTEKEAIDAELSTLRSRLAATESPPDLSGVEKMLTANWADLYKTLPDVDKAAFWRKLLKKITVSPEREIDFIFNA